MQKKKSKRDVQKHRSIFHKQRRVERKLMSYFVNKIRFIVAPQTKETARWSLQVQFYRLHYTGWIAGYKNYYCIIETQLICVTIRSVHYN